jgi:enolase
LSKLAIERVLAWEALDSRGNPTVACEVRLSGGAAGTATVPSGASTGTHEAHELRDGGDRYAGLGAAAAVRNAAGELAAAILGIDAGDQATVDAALRAADGTENLRRLGANAVLAVSVASAVAAAAGAGEPLYRLAAAGAGPLLPLPMVNIVSGGRHAGWATDIQDFLAVPIGAASFAEAIEWAWRVRRATAQLAAEKGLVAALVADEGGLGPALPSNRAGLDLLARGIERSGLAAGEDVAIALDVAGTQLRRPGGSYALASENRSLEAGELVSELAAWTAEYPIVSLEDPLAEDDWDGWAVASTQLGSIQLLGDDLFATNLARLEQAIELQIANAVLVKPNQIGTLSQALATIVRARAAGYATVLSARSGDTEDSWLADLAVGWRTGQIKVGSTMRSERTAKWNRLLRIEAELGADAEFAGRAALSGPPGSSGAPARRG